MAFSCGQPFFAGRISKDGEYQGRGAGRSDPCPEKVDDEKRLSAGQKLFQTGFGQNSK